MPELNLQPDDAIRWFSAQEDMGSPTDPVLREWLTDEGLLTGRLRRQCGVDFRLEVIEDSSRQSPGSRHDETRRIVLWCGDQPCIYAETLLPEKTTAKLPWLRELGKQPLGETLQRRQAARRGEFEYALLAPTQLPVGLPVQIDIDLWARRSEFYVGDTSLLVTEIFLPGILECATHGTPAEDQN